MFDSGDHSQLVQLFIVARLGLGGWDVADRLEETPVVEPVHPFEGGEFDRFGMAPRPASVDHLRFEQAIDGLRQSVVVAVSDTADRRFDTGFGQTFSVADRDILYAPITVMHEAIPLGRAAIVRGLLQGIEHEAGLCRARHAPADDPPGGVAKGSACVAGGMATEGKTSITKATWTKPCQVAT